MPFFGWSLLSVVFAFIFLCTLKPTLWLGNDLGRRAAVVPGTFQTTRRIDTIAPGLMMNNAPPTAAVTMLGVLQRLQRL